MGDISGQFTHASTVAGEAAVQGQDLAPPDRGLAAPPRRTHTMGHAEIGVRASAFCAVSGGCGMFMGLLTPADGLAGYLIPLMASIAVTAVVAGLWHALIKAAYRVRTPTGYMGTGLATAATVAIAVGASSWPVAATLSGSVALQAYQRDVAARQANAEQAAWIQAIKEHNVISLVHEAEAGWTNLSDGETRFGTNSRPGRGPIATAMAAAARSYAGQADRLERAWQFIESQHARAVQLERTQGEAAGANPAVFAKAAADLRDIISAEANFQITGLVSTSDMFDVHTLTSDDAVADRVQAEANLIFKNLRSNLRIIEDDRSVIAIPDYTPIQAREAVWLYAGSAALGGWICAIAVDLAPALWIVFLMCTAKEPFLASEDGSGRDLDPDTGKLRLAASSLHRPAISR